jgi:phytoene synthase
VSRDTSFYYSFLVLPAAKRDATVAVWDFCRAVDDEVDEPGEGSPKAALDAWRLEIGRCYTGTPETRQGRQLQPFVSRFNLPRRPFEDLIDGVEMDLTRSRYADFEELYEYCWRVASTVGLICLEIFGYRQPAAREYAITLGIALQLTNIVRDVATDLARGRVYLPQSDLVRFGCTDDDLRRGEVTPAVQALLAFECARAHEYYEKADRLLPREDRHSLVAARIMGGIYHAILERIERNGYDVFSGTVRVPRARRAAIAASTWARSLVS